MLAQPNPTPLHQLVEAGDVAKHRRLFCGWYDHCLEQAVKDQWPSWTCEHCPLFVVALSVPRVLA